MFSFLKKEKLNLNPAYNMKRLQEKILKTTVNFENRLIEIESFANSLFQKTEQHETQLNRMKQFCHAINILISDKDKNLKLIFANHLTCSKLYGLPEICSELIEGRYEYEVINDFIEKTNTWNSFIECSSFNIDEIVKQEMKQKEFLQVGYINNEEILLHTNIKPYLVNSEFNGVMTISNLISDEEFQKLKKDSIALYHKNDYLVYEIC